MREWWVGGRKRDIHPTVPKPWTNWRDPRIAPGESQLWLLSGLPSRLGTLRTQPSASYWHEKGANWAPDLEVLHRRISEAAFQVLPNPFRLRSLVSGELQALGLYLLKA